MSAIVVQVLISWCSLLWFYSSLFFIPFICRYSHDVTFFCLDGLGWQVPMSFVGMETNDNQTDITFGVLVSRRSERSVKVGIGNGLTIPCITPSYTWSSSVVQQI